MKKNDASEGLIFYFSNFSFEKLYTHVRTILLIKWSGKMGNQPLKRYRISNSTNVRRRLMG